MIAKLIVWGRDRTQALQRLARALDEYRITGLPTTLPLLRALIDVPPVVAMRAPGANGAKTLAKGAPARRAKAPAGNERFMPHRASPWKRTHH